MWLFSKSTKSNLPEPTALQAQKSKQIEQLKNFNQNVIEIHRDVEYRVNAVVNGLNISLYITLPPQFPQDKPTVKVSPPVRHPWVNDEMLVVGCPGLNNFVMHSDLGKAIRSIIDEFQRSSPTVVSPLPYDIGLGGAAPPPYQMSAHLPPYNAVGGSRGSVLPLSYMPPVSMPTLPPHTSSSHLNQTVERSSNGSILSTSSMSNCMVAPAIVAPSITSTTPYQPPASSVLNQDDKIQLSYGVASSCYASYQTPEIPLTFSQLTDLSLSELQSLSDDEDRLLQIVMNLPQLKKIATDRDNVCQKNELQAKSNVAQKPLVEEKKRVLLEKYDELNDLRRKFEELLEEQDKLRNLYDPQRLQNNLKVAALQAEEEAEKIAEKFIEGSITVQEFNRDYIEKRKLGHLRKIKEEKLSQYVT